MATLTDALALAMENHHEFRDDFIAWLNANFPIFEYFERAAQHIFNTGRNHYSARTIVEVMRHRTALREIGDGSWKLNNDRTPDMARLYILLHPEQEGFFELRGRKAA